MKLIQKINLSKLTIRVKLLGFSLRMKYLVLKNRVLRFLGLKSSLPVYYVGGPDMLPPPLSQDEEAYLLDHFDDKEMDVKTILIEHNLRLVVYIAKKFENTYVNIEDLVSIGTIGLIKAINTFAPEKNIKLATYASRCIENEILMYLRRSNRQKSEISIDEPLRVDWDGNELLLSDILSSDSDTVHKSLDDEVDHHLLREALKKLSIREKKIMDLRFGLTGGSERTQKEVADMLGISQSYISRLEKRIIGRLKKDMLKMS